MVLGKLPVPGHLTFWIIVGQVPGRPTFWIIVGQGGGGGRVV